MNVEFLAAAETELDQAYQWYEQQQSGLGKQFLSEFDAAIRRITAFPKSYVLIDTDIRRCLIKRFPYAVLYGIDRQSIIVVAVAHLHRKPDYWLARIG